MKNTLLIVMATLALAGCHPTKPAIGSSTDETIVITGDNAEQMLNRIEMNLHELQMLDNDVVDNVDAIIAIQERTGAIVKAIEADTTALTLEQRARFRALKSKLTNE